MIKIKFKRCLKKVTAFVTTVAFAMTSFSGILPGVGKMEEVKADDTNTMYYYYTGGEQVFTAPYDAEYTFELYGGYGGGTSRNTLCIPLSNNRAVAAGDYDKTKWNSGYIDERDWSKTTKVVNGYGGRGGYTAYKVYLTKGTTIYINVGGQGDGYYRCSASKGGYNGGGDAKQSWVGCGGGGATSIATYSGTLKTLFESGWSGSILAVAGGGGGADDILYGVDIRDGESHETFYEDSEGGDGGGEAGTPGYWLYNKDGPIKYENYLGQVRDYEAGETRAEAGTQTTGYKQGTGQAADEVVGENKNDPADAGGGGGGYWGGYCGAAQTYVKGESNYSGANTGGGGGSGYVNKGYNGYKGSTMTTGGNGTYGHGYVKITYMGSYTLTFCPNNGENTYTRTVISGTGNWNMVDGQVPSYSGYSFGGWYTGANGTGEQVYDASGKAVKGTYWTDNGSNARWQGATDLTLYAKWTADAVYYTVTLYFCKDGVKDDSKTRTYSVGDGTAFSPYDHRVDESFGEHCEYSSVSREPWTVNSDSSASVYYVTKKYTQTLHFYKDGTEDPSKKRTYDVKYGEVFDAYSHRSDESFGDDYSYSSIGQSSWTVTGEGSTNVHYVRGVFTQTLNFYKNGVYMKSCTYSAAKGSTFNAASHADDMTGDTDFAHCHYDHMSVSGTSWTVTGDASADVYYVWDTYTITYNGNGSTGGSTAASTATSHGSSATVASNGFTRTGYHFTGWNTATDGSGTAYSEGSSMTMTGNVTLYAQWSIDRHTVTLNKGNGISGVSGAGTYDYGSSVSIDATPATGYSWSKWTDGAGNTASTTKNYKFTIYGSDLSFTANATPNSYTVSLNANGGSCVDGSGNAVSSVDVTYDSGNWNNVSGLRVSKDGYEFTGWIANATGSREPIWDINGLAKGGSYWNGNGDSAVWKYTGNVTASADWKDVTSPVMSVSPESSSGYAASMYITVTASDNDRLAADNVYEYCLGADSSAPPSGASWSSYQSGVPINIGSTLSGTYYLWIKHVKDATGNTSVSSPNADYHRFGPYYFDNTAPDLSGVLSSYGWFFEGTTITFNISDAHSGIKSAVLTDFNGVPLDNGDITSGRQYYFGSEGPAFYCLTVTDSVGNTAKKLFLVKIDSKGEVIPDNAVWKGLGNLALFAHWSANSYTVHFEKNDNDSGSTRAIGSMSDATFTYDRDENLPANGFSRTGYYFDGWNESADGTSNNGSIYQDKAVVRNLTLTPGGKITLFAQWNPCNYTLTFNYNKPGNATGTLRDAGEASRTVTFDVSIGRLPEPKLTGWTFEGWYIKNADGTSVKIGNNEIWHYTSGRTAVAKWTAVKYEVRLHSNVPEDALDTLVKKLSGTTGASWTWREGEYYSAVFTYDTESYLPTTSETFEIDGYNINGWYADIYYSKYIGNGGYRKWNLALNENVVVDLYPIWSDATAPLITVTPGKTTNAAPVQNNAVKNQTVTISITERGSGLAENNKYEYALTTSKSQYPSNSEWHIYTTSQNKKQITVELNALGSDLTGQYYIWVKCVHDRAGNVSDVTKNDGYIGVANNSFIFGVYNFDNTPPVGDVTYSENFDDYVNAISNGESNPELTSVLMIKNGMDNTKGSEVKNFFVKIYPIVKNEYGNEYVSNNYNEYDFTSIGNNEYTISFNLYSAIDDILSEEERKQVTKVYLVVYGQDWLGNTSRLKVSDSINLGTDVTIDDIHFTPINSDDPNRKEINETDLPKDLVIVNPTTDDDIHIYERDAFRVEAQIYNVVNECNSNSNPFTGGSYAKLKVYTFGNVEKISVNFDANLKKTLNESLDTALDMYNNIIYTAQKNMLLCKEEKNNTASSDNKFIDIISDWTLTTWHKQVDLATTQDVKLQDINAVNNDKKYAITTHELFIPVYAAENNFSIYDNNIIVAIKNGAAQLRKIKIYVSDRNVLGDLKTQIVGPGSND